MLEALKINGEWRVVWARHLESHKRSGCAGKLATQIVFRDWYDALDYIARRDDFGLKNCL